MGVKCTHTHADDHIKYYELNSNIKYYELNSNSIAAHSCESVQVIALPAVKGFNNIIEFLCFDKNVPCLRLSYLVVLKQL